MSLLSLNQIKSDTGISYPALLRYKNHPAMKKFIRGEGRTARFVKAAVPLFFKLRADGLAKRGKRG